MSAPGSDSGNLNLYVRLSQQLQEVFGLQLDPAGKEIAAAVGTRRESLGLSLDEYQNLLSGADASEELLNLAGKLSLDQTVFNDEHLLEVSQRFFKGLLRSRLANRPEGAKPSLSIWSAGCGCGGQITSVLLQLADLTDLSAWDLRVLATDISARRLAQARAQMTNQIRSLVDFRVHNILAPQLPTDADSKFNLILCRALLKQLSPQAKTLVLSKFARALSPDGLLIVAETESVGSDHPLLQPVSADFACVLCRRVARAGQALPEVSELQLSLNLPPLRSRLRRIFLPTSAGSAVRRKKPTTVVDDRAMATQFLQRAQQLAEDFQFPQALLVCRRAGRLDAFNLAAHFMTGVIARRMDRLDEAIEAFERACYLDKNLVMAHFLLGHIYQEMNKPSLARHHYDRALESLADKPDDEHLLFAEGISVPVLRELCTAGKDALAQIEVGELQ